MPSERLSLHSQSLFLYLKSHSRLSRSAPLQADWRSLVLLLPGGGTSVFPQEELGSLALRASLLGVALGHTEPLLPFPLLRSTFEIHSIGIFHIYHTVLTHRY